MKDPCELGIGVVYSPRIARVLDLDTVDVLEVEPQMFWQATGEPNDPVRIDTELFSQLRAMPQTKLVHSVTLPFGNSRPHDPRALRQLAESIAGLGAPYASEHLSFNQFDAGTERLWTGFLLPPKQDEHGVAAAAARIDEMRRAVRVPVAFETGVNYLRPKPGELSDGGFFRRVADEADCGILLDLHNLLANERNGRDSLRRVFEEIPRDRVWEIHLAGGMEYRGYWLDSHSSHIEDELFDAAREVVAECPNLRAIIFEIMGEHVHRDSGAALREDVRRLRSLWTERKRRRLYALPQARPEKRRADGQRAQNVQRREETLGALAVGNVPRDAEPGVASDPATALYADLVASMREGVLYETMPYTIRLLLVTIGPEPLMNLISTYRASVVPQMFGADEARKFNAYVRTLNLNVPHLAEILDFEEALSAVRGTLEARTIAFDCNPVALFCAIDQKRSPSPLASERVYVEVSEYGLAIRT